MVYLDCVSAGSARWHAGDHRRGIVQKDPVQEQPSQTRGREGEYERHAKLNCEHALQTFANHLLLRRSPLSQFSVCPVHIKVYR